MQNIPQFLLHHIEETPNKPYLHSHNESISYSQLYNRIQRTTNGLLEIGIRSEDTVCIMMDNGPEYLDIWMSLSFLGAISVPLNVHLKGEGLQYIIQHSESKVIFVDHDYLPNVLACLEKIPQSFQVIVISNEPVGERIVFPHLKIISYASLLSNNQSYSLSAVDPGSIHSILYTSGTTGRPKGVMLTHASFIESARSFANQMIGVQQDDILYTCLPLFHINAQAHTVLGSISKNATIALSEKFSASKFWDEIRFYQATIFNSLGSMIHILCKQPKKQTDRNHSARITACAATPKEFWRPFEERFGVQIVEGYGLTETTGFCLSNPLNASRPPSIGKPYPFVEAKIVDEQGEELPPNQRGEIIIRSNKQPFLMKGYYKNPIKTQEVLRDGWFYTGDHGHIDEDGYLYFYDRHKQCIRRRGENISSWEIEKIVNQHKKVLDSAAVGVPSDVGEEDVKLYVVPKKDETLTPEEIIRWCEERMAYFMVPRYIEWMEAFPKTATERIQKFKLKELGINNAWDREKMMPKQKEARKS
ncbi:crotonobetaine/carnitine-CoA ligase [Oikeobacillus pervagus]|uniref:Crotonobetaine/carnitine-CoA ligase n=1 Tax=Oikeobacillus pervagus TaxID=1325931 RepID=A0AAJ1T5B4_9BACI|nr:crotonobetaine/carnitine-CoA ligase [Oikeobacillus pervagus]